MPLFGLLPYDDDEEERRKRMLTPPMLPAPSGRMLPPPSMPGGEPTGMLGPVGPRPLTRPEQLAEERHVYQAGTPTRGRSALRGAFEGFAGGGLGGALTGAIYGAADPAGLRRRRFEREEKPRLFEQFALEDAEAERLRRQQAGELDTEYKRAQIGELGRRNQPRPLPPPRLISTPTGLRNPVTGELMPGTAPPPKKAAPQRVWTDKGMVDVSKLPPEELGKLRPYQRPRQSGGGGGGVSKRDMRSAGVLMRQFERLKGEAIRAQQEGEEELYSAKRNEMEAMADQIDALYGDSVEVGVGGDWPYVKFRQGGRGRTVQPQGGATPEQVQQIIAEAKKRGRTVTEAEVRARLKARGQ